jgi:hypothetical protein
MDGPEVIGAMTYCRGYAMHQLIDKVTDAKEGKEICFLGLVSPFDIIMIK